MSVFWKNANLRLAFEYIAKGNVKEAQKHLYNAVSEDDHYAHLVLYDCFEHGGFGVSKNLASTKTFKAKIVRKFGRYAPFDEYGWALMTNSMSQAEEYGLIAAKQGNVVAQYLLTDLCHNYTCLKQAADSGYAPAQHVWYRRYQDISYLQKAVNQEHDDSKLDLGREYFRKGDTREAAKCYVSSYYARNLIVKHCDDKLVAATFEQKYVYGEHIQKIRWSTAFEEEEVDTFFGVLHFYEQVNNQVKAKVHLWLLVSKRKGMMKDLRILIAKYIWQSRFWENPPRRRKK